MNSSFIPSTAIIHEIRVENRTIATFRLELTDKTIPFSFQPGQFCMLSVPHCGEAAISISSSPSMLPHFDLSIRNAGKLTGAIHTMQAGDLVGIRGPFGTPFPIKSFANSDLLFIAGGIGLAPLKSVIDYCLFQNTLEDDGVQSICLLYGSKTPSEVAFSAAIRDWQDQGLTCELTVDAGDHDWEGHIGLVTDLLQQDLITEKTKVLLCGPPMMIRFVISLLCEMGISSDSIYTTLERHMKCGIGICGHCHLDGKLVCKDGPVFSLHQLQSMNVMELGEF
jgi:anaerobic sulfite reductase subunit B